MSKFVKENWKILLSFLILIILFPIIILVPSPIGYIPRDTGLQIVGYGGSILGGFLTLYGVWWTIKDNEKKRHEDLAIQYKPILIISAVSPFTNHLSYIKPKIDDHIVEYPLRLKNLGRGEALNIRIKLQSNESIYRVSFKESHMNHFNFLVPHDGGIRISFCLRLVDDIQKPIKDCLKDFPPKFTVSISYCQPFEDKDKTIKFTVEHIYNDPQSDIVITSKEI